LPFICMPKGGTFVAVAILVGIGNNPNGRLLNRA
jgi:hypothetical protein